MLTGGLAVKNGHVLEENTPYTKEIDVLIYYLLSCSVNKIKQDAERVKEMDLDAV